MSDSILRVSGLKKTFNKNGVEIHVLKGIDLDTSKYWNLNFITRYVPTLSTVEPRQPRPTWSS